MESKPLPARVVAALRVWERIDYQDTNLRRRRRLTWRLVSMLEEMTIDEAVAYYQEVQRRLKNGDKQ